MDSPVAADMRIPAEQAARIRVEAIRARELTQVVAHTLPAATAVVDEATMAAVEEPITVGAVTAGITAGAASDWAWDFTGPRIAMVMVTLRVIAVPPDIMIAGATGFPTRVARLIRIE
jgi:hypothetical protein